MIVVGSTVALEEHRLTRAQGVRGVGVVTVVNFYDPLNHRVKVVVRTSAGYLHLEVPEDVLSEEVSK